MNKFLRIIKAELLSNRESMTYWELEIFVGCILATCKQEGLITPEEEKRFRKFLMED